MKTNMYHLGCPELEKFFINSTGTPRKKSAKAPLFYQ